MSGREWECAVREYAMSFGIPNIDRGRCSGCGRCVSACPERLLSLEASGYRKEATMRDPASCTRCGKCVENCAVGALAAEGEGKLKSKAGNRDGQD